MTTHQSLQHTEARARFDLLSVEQYDVRLDLAASDETFGSVTTIRFSSKGGPTFVDLKPARVHEIRFNGRVVDPELLDRGRLPLETEPGANELVVDATMRFRNDGEGLHRSVDPADGKHYVYGMSFMDAAPSIFACFDQPDLKAPYTFHVLAPADWVVVGNSPASNPEPGVWEFETTQPLSTYFVTLVAGPYHLVRDEHDGIPLGLSARASIAKDLDADADELLTMTRQCFDEFHRLFGIRYPFGDYHQAFVPEFNAGAMENPGCVTFRDPLIFSSRVTRGVRIQRATTVAHEMAHQWFGNIVTPKWWDDLWLNESFAEYMGNRVTADVTEYDDAWTHNAYARRQWGLIADQRPSTHPVAGNGAFDASAALQDFDGISYAKGSSILKQLNTMLGDDVFFAGAIDHFTTHRFGNATMHDLFASWEKAGAGDLSSFTGNWLRTAGPDTIVLDRAAGVVRRTPPADHPADRAHTFRVAAAAPEGKWEVTTVQVQGSETPYSVADGAAVVLDPYEDSWALVQPDPATVAALKALLPRTDDTRLRAGIWNNVRSAFHNAALDPADALDLLEAGIPVEDSDDAIFTTMPWAMTKVAALAADPEEALRRIHATAVAKVHATPAGSTLQLSAFQAAASSAQDADLLRAWLRGDDLPDGIELDLDLRWRILVRLAVLGKTDRDELHAALDAEPTAVSRVEHSRAMASLPDAEAKAWAWQRFTGEVDVPNYELEAAGLGMWRHGQEELTAPYVDRYFAELPGTVDKRSGWLLADAAEAFFPMTALSEETLAKARALIDDETVDLSLRRRLVDDADELAHRLAIRRAVPGVVTVRGPAMSDRARRPGPTVRTRVTELTTSGERRHEDRLATEEPLEIRLAWPGAPARRVWVTMRTPGHDFELAAGWLVHEGVARPGDIGTVAYCTDVDLAPEQEFNVVTVTLAAPPAADPGHRHTTQATGSSACGVCGKDSIDAALTVSPAGRWTGPLPEPDVVRRLPDLLRERQAVFSRTGGVHAAGLFDAEGSVLVVREDVGRHNAVDKVTGARVLAGDPPAAACLVVSGRAGFELVQKATSVGVGALVSVGAPTSLSVELARKSGLALYGFTSVRRCVRYT